MDPQQTPLPQNPTNPPYAPSPNPGVYNGTPPAPGAQPYGAPLPLGSPSTPGQNPLAAPSPYVDPVPEDPTAPATESASQPTEITTTISHDTPAAFEAPAPLGGVATNSGAPMQPGFAGNGPASQPDFSGQNPAYGAYNSPQFGTNANAQGGPGMQEPPTPPGALPNAAEPLFGAQPGMPPAPGAQPFGSQAPMPPQPGAPGAWSPQPGASNPSALAGQMPPAGVSPSMVAPPQQPAGPLPPVINGHNQRREPKALFLTVMGLVVLGLAVLIAYLISRGK